MRLRNRAPQVAAVGLVVMNSDRSGQRRLTLTGANVGWLAWSPR